MYYSQYIYIYIYTHSFSEPVAELSQGARCRLTSLAVAVVRPARYDSNDRQTAWAHALAMIWLCDSCILLASAAHDFLRPKLQAVVANMIPPPRVFLLLALALAKLH